MDRGVVSGRNRGDLTPLSCDNEAAAAAASARLSAGARSGYPVTDEALSFDWEPADRYFRESCRSTRPNSLRTRLIGF